MESASEHGFARRQSTKRSYSTMAHQHRAAEDDSSSSLFIPQHDAHDDHYNNEHTSRRPRLALPPMRPTPRFAGDGYDFRRPVMSTGNVTSAAAGAAPVIDLTDDDNTQRVGGNEDSQQSRRHHAAAVDSSSSRATRLPRFGGRDIINLAETGDDGADEEEPSRQGHELPSASRLSDLWGPRAERPRYSQLRRPARFDTQATRATASGVEREMDNDDLEIVSERPRSRASRQHTPGVPTLHRSVTPYPADLQGDFVDLTEDNDDVVHLDTRPRVSSGLNAMRPGTTAGVGTRSLHIDEDDDDPMVPGFGHGFGLGRIANALRIGGGAEHMPHLMARIGVREEELRTQEQRLAALARGHMAAHIANRNARHGNGAAGRAPRGNPHAAGAVGLPTLEIAMDYGGIAFDMPGAQRDPSPKYSPPPPAEKGFTRNPAEDEAVVCPNCGDELAVSTIPDDAAREEVKQQVWVIKSCGHAYCGECAQNRGRKLSKKGKGKAPETVTGLPPPFGKCVVDGCGKSASKSGMIQVYIGS